MLNKLVSIGITQTPNHINLSDEEDPIRVKLYATEPEEAHLLSLLTPHNTPADANISMLLLQKANLNEQPQLKRGLLEDKYQSLDDFFNGAKLLFSDEAAKEVKAIALRKFDEDPNIRAVVSCTHDDKVEMFSLPMNDRQLTMAMVKLEEYSAGECALKIEALHFKHPWPDVFNDVLQSEGLAAVNSFAAAFPYLEDLRKYAAVIEYAGVTDSKSLIRLADHIDDFEYYPECRDAGDVAREWMPAARKGFPSRSTSTI